MPGDWLLLLIDALAVHRLVRLAAKDTITRPLRAVVIRWAYLHHPDHTDMTPDLLDGMLDEMVEADLAENPDRVPKLAVLVVCRWCVSVYVAAGVVAVRAWWPEVWQWPAYGLALASLGVLLAGLERD